MKVKNALVILIAPLVIAGCQAKSSFDIIPSLKAQAVSASLEPHSMTPVNIGPLMVIQRNNGEQSTVTVVSVADDFYRVETNDDRSWTEPTNAFLPALEWSAEEWGQGKQETSNVKGELFPLEVGNKMSMEVNGSSTLYPEGWSDTRDCEVTAQERVTVIAGEFDTYKVVCTQGNRVRVTNFSPELNHSVSFQNIHTKDSSRSSGWKLVESL